MTPHWHPIKLGSPGDFNECMVANFVYSVGILDFPVEFSSQEAGHRLYSECVVEQRLARQAHNLEVVGSIPTGASRSFDDDHVT